MKLSERNRKKDRGISVNFTEDLSHLTERACGDGILSASFMQTHVQCSNSARTTSQVLDPSTSSSTSFADGRGSSVRDDGGELSEDVLRRHELTMPSASNSTGSENGKLESSSRNSYAFATAKIIEAPQMQAEVARLAAYTFEGNVNAARRTNSNETWLTDTDSRVSVKLPQGYQPMDLDGVAKHVGMEAKKSVETLQAQNIRSTKPRKHNRRKASNSSGARGLKPGSNVENIAMNLSTQDVTAFLRDFSSFLQRMEQHVARLQRASTSSVYKSDENQFTAGGASRSVYGLHCGDFVSMQQDVQVCACLDERLSIAFSLVHDADWEKGHSQSFVSTKLKRDFLILHQQYQRIEAQWRHVKPLACNTVNGEDGVCLPDLERGRADFNLGNSKFRGEGTRGSNSGSALGAFMQLGEAKIVWVADKRPQRFGIEKPAGAGMGMKNAFPSGQALEIFPDHFAVSSATITHPFNCLQASELGLPLCGNNTLGSLNNGKSVLLPRLRMGSVDKKDDYGALTTGNSAVEGMECSMDAKQVIPSCEVWRPALLLEVDEDEQEEKQAILRQKQLQQLSQIESCVSALRSMQEHVAAEVIAGNELILGAQEDTQVAAVNTSEGAVQLIRASKEKSRWWSVQGGAASALVGMGVGAAAAGPVGAAIGAIVGGASGVASGAVMTKEHHRKLDRTERRLRERNRKHQTRGNVDVRDFVAPRGTIRTGQARNHGRPKSGLHSMLSCAETLNASLEGEQ